ncbi:MAG: DMT family transporter [Pseudomonadota bacterium]
MTPIAKTIDWKSWASLAILVVFWGSSFLFISFTLESFSPFFVTGARLLMAALFVGVIARILAGPFPRQIRFWLWCTPVGMFGLIAPFTLYTWAQVEVPSGVVAIYIAASPLLVLVLSHFITDERLTRRGAVGFVVGFAGVILLIGMDNLRQLGGGVTFWRELAAFGAACAFAMGAITVRLMPRYNPLHATAGALIISACLYAPLTVAEVPSATPVWTALGALAVLGIAQTGVAQITRYLLIKRSGAVFASQASYLLPIWAVFLGWLFLDETLTAEDAAGFILILSGVAVAQFRPLSARRSD